MESVPLEKEGTHGLRFRSISSPSSHIRQGWVHTPGERPQNVISRSFFTLSLVLLAMSLIVGGLFQSVAGTDAAETVDAGVTHHFENLPDNPEFGLATADERDLQLIVGPDDRSRVSP